eukprot:8646750-Ditylum_brightwellii.AAC.1
MNFKDTTKTINILLACQAHMMIKGKIIRRQLKQSIRDAMNATYITIDWNTVGRLLMQQDYDLHWLFVQFINHRLPLQGDKYMVSDDKACPCCKRKIETAMHFLCCTGDKGSWAVLDHTLQQ